MKKAGWEPASWHGWEWDNMNPEPWKVKGEADVIFFDAAGTLIHLARPAGWHYALIAQEYGLEVNADRMEAAFRAVWKSRPLRAASAGPREEDDRPWWRALALDVLHAAIPTPKIDENAWFDTLYTHFAEPGVWVLYDDAARCLDRFAKRYRLAVISNFDKRLRRVLEDLGLSERFEKIIISSEVGCEKPDPEIFRRAVEIMDVAPGRCLHVGDDPDNDWEGAAAAGMAVFRVKRPEVTLDTLT